MDDGSRDLFKQAKLCIWGATLESDPANNPDRAALISLQELAVSLVNRADISFDLGENGKHGLLESQAQWRRNRSQETQKNKESSPLEGQLSCAMEKPPDHLTYAWDSGGDNPARSRHESQTPLREEMHNDPAIPSMSTVAVLLIAGAIFGIVLTFLLCMSISPAWASIS